MRRMNATVFSRALNEHNQHSYGQCGRRTYPIVMQSMNHLVRVFLILSFLGLGVVSCFSSSSPSSAGRVKGSGGLRSRSYAGKALGLTLAPVSFVKLRSTDLSRSCCHLKFGGAVIKLMTTNRRNSFTSNTNGTYSRQYPADLALIVRTFCW